MILQNEIKCLKCGDQIYSGHRHDFKHCECGAVAVDGGMDYLRRLGYPEQIEELSITVDDKHIEEMLDILKDTENNWNDLGKICAIARYMRDHMGINIGARQ
jgi:hypothetical protein